MAQNSPGDDSKSFPCSENSHIFLPSSYLGPGWQRSVVPETPARYRQCRPFDDDSQLVPRLPRAAGDDRQMVHRLHCTHTPCYRLSSTSSGAGVGDFAYAGDTGSKYLYQKLVQQTCTKNLTQVHGSFLHQTTLQPITLHGSCHTLNSFCAGIELC